MPELPEVETTRRGIAPALVGQTFAGVTLRQSRLRWPVREDLGELLAGERVTALARRAKYLAVEMPKGAMLVHLGMSGSLRVHAPGRIPEVQKHDHIDWTLDNGSVLRLRDPRRFGAVLWTDSPWQEHPLLQRLGPEPLEENFNAAYLHHILSRQQRAVKVALMDQAVVVGVGNIYANEALFAAAILPQRPADSLTLPETERLVAAVKTILAAAIAAGGSSLRDYVGSDGAHGWFQQHYAVYGRHGQPCPRCTAPIARIVLGQRASFYCPECQN